MGYRFFQNIFGEVRRNLFCACGTLRLHQVCVEVTGHQYLIPIGPPADGRDNILYDQGVVVGSAAPHNMPLFPSHFQMEVDGVRSVEEKCLRDGMLCLVVKDVDSTNIMDRILGRRDPLPSQLPCVNPPHNLLFLKESKVNVLL